MSVYATDGSFRLTVVDGLSWTGVYAHDQSINVVVTSGTNWAGTYHPCGAWWVTVAPSGTIKARAPNGSLYVQETPYTTGGQKVTVVSGSLSGGGGTPGAAGTSIGLLLALTYP